ncbi:MAG: acyl-CoA dehydrogenase family protein, partial [Pseudomonadota bacterium]
MSLDSEQAAIFDMAHDFGQSRIAPHARDWEDAGTIPRELWPDVADLGLSALFVKEENGGAGLSRHDATLVFDLEHQRRIGWHHRQVPRLAVRQRRWHGDEADLSDAHLRNRG